MPDDGTIHAAIAHRQAGRRADAERACFGLLERDPNHAAALHVLTLLAQDQRRLTVAVRLAELAVAAAPTAAEFRNTLGTALAGVRRWDDAVAAFRQALGLRPDYADAMHNLGTALARAGRLGEAAAAYRQALGLRPDDLKACDDLIAVGHESNDPAGVVDTLRRLAAARPADAGPGSELLYALHYARDSSPDVLFAAHTGWATRHADPLRSNWRPFANAPAPDRRLRVGYVSAGFRAHPVARFQTAEMAARDRGHHELICYNSVARADAVTDRLRGLADGWVDASGLTDEQLAERVRADGIDVLVDLDGHDSGNRLLCFARRPAPVQVTYNGYVDTTGMAAMDWRLTDEWHDPPGLTERYHTERLYRLAGGNWCYDPDLEGDGTPDVGDLPAAANGSVTFGCLNKLIKVTPAALRLWGRLLEAVPGSRLVLSPPGHPNTHTYLQNLMAGHGLPPGRVDLVPKTPTRRAYLDRFNALDVSLDPFPFAGITTTCDSLWMGVPVVSLAGQTFVSRSGVSLLTAVGLPDPSAGSGQGLIAHTEDEYVRIAVELASDLPRLAAVRRGLRDRMKASPLCDGPAFARKLEAAYRFMWRDWCERQTGAAAPAAGSARRT